ncbi:MAG: DUF6125 family protein [Candidatus Nezhaarchaeales archaeon]
MDVVISIRKLLKTKKDLEKYVEFLLKHYRLIDAFWFLNVEERFGMEAAVEINEKIWSSIGRIAARDLKEKFNVKGGLEGFRKAFNLYPWSIIISHRIRRREGSLIIKTPHCPPQEARRRHGLPEFPCKPMHQKELTNFAKVIDENIEVECKYAPPDKHPKHLWCEWEVKTKP